MDVDSTLCMPRKYIYICRCDELYFDSSKPYITANRWNFQHFTHEIEHTPQEEKPNATQRVIIHDKPVRPRGLTRTIYINHEVLSEQRKHGGADMSTFLHLPYGTV